jgi:hypothetical protein
MRCGGWVQPWRGQRSFPTSLSAEGAEKPGSSRERRERRDGPMRKINGERGGK